MNEFLDVKKEWESSGHVVAIGDIKYQIAPVNLVQVKNGVETQFFSFQEVYDVAVATSMKNGDDLGGWRIPTLAEWKLIEAYVPYSLNYPAGVFNVAEYAMTTATFAETLGLTLPGSLMIIGAVNTPDPSGNTGYWACPSCSPGYMELNKKHVSFRNIEIPGEHLECKPDLDDENPSFKYGFCIRLIREIVD